MFLKTKKNESIRSGISEKQAKDLAKIAKRLKSKQNIKRVNKEHS